MKPDDQDGSIPVGDEQEESAGVKAADVKMPWDNPELQAAFREAEEDAKAALEQNPDNGKAGWWRVWGIRHGAIVRTDSAPEAVRKALAAGAVGDWEDPAAAYIGPELPDVYAT